MTLEEKENCKNQNESERLRNRWKNNNEAWEKDNQRTATDEEEKVLQEKIDVEAAQDMLINKIYYSLSIVENTFEILLSLVILMVLMFHLHQI